MYTLTQRLPATCSWDTTNRLFMPLVSPSLLAVRGERTPSRLGVGLHRFRTFRQYTCGNVQTWITIHEFRAVRIHRSALRAQEVFSSERHGKTSGVSFRKHIMGSSRTNKNLCSGSALTREAVPAMLTSTGVDSSVRETVAAVTSIRWRRPGGQGS